MNFFERLEQRARKIDSVLCVGLDPRAQDAASAREECFRLIDATAEFALAFKPNAAFFEAFGAEGLAALKAVIAHVPAGIPVILDAKRGDIAATAEAYARAAFDELGAQAITLNPYLGGEALQPFLTRSERGAFVLCKTSNPGADEFQCLRVHLQEDASSASNVLYEMVAQHAQEWNVNGNVGLVVGATDPQALARVRSAAPDLWFLVPGIGAQGGDLKASLEAGLRADGLGLLINVSRSISQTADPGAAAQKIRDEINHWQLEMGNRRHVVPGTACRRRAGRAAREARRETGQEETGTGAPESQSATSPLPPLISPARLAQDLVDSQCVRFGQFTLKSGIISPIYLDLRRLVTHPAILWRVAQAYAGKLEELSFDRLAGIPYAALPIATTIALTIDCPLIYPRREAKDYGTQAAIEGDFQAGETIVVIDDLATTGGSKIEAIQKLEEAGLKVRDIVVLIDRGQGAGAMLAEAGYRLHSIVDLHDLLPMWLRSGAISQAQFEEVTAFLKG
ncbi:uridine monophosphate synthetase [Thermoflexales bacterium]|nr:uridine monophosphate synthetase [Thermoflexales bacterium]